MMRVLSKVIMNMPKIKALTQAQVTALEQTAEALHGEIVQAQVVPRDTGNLQNEAFFVNYEHSKDGEVSLVHSTPYARRLYYHPEFHFQTDENPNAKAHWFEDWQEGGDQSEFAINAYKQMYRRLAGL